MIAKRSMSRTPELARRLARLVGSRLKAVRRERKLAQDAFAAAMGISRTTASNIESGKQRLFLDQIYQAAEILGVPVDHLLPNPQVVNDKRPVVHAAVDDPLPKDLATQMAVLAEKLKEDIGLKRPRRSKDQSER